MSARQAVSLLLLSVHGVDLRLVVLQQLRSLELEGWRYEVLLHGELLCIQVYLPHHLESLQRMQMNNAMSCARHGIHAPNTMSKVQQSVKPLRAPFVLPRPLSANHSCPCRNIRLVRAHDLQRQCAPKTTVIEFVDISHWAQSSLAYQI